MKIHTKSIITLIISLIACCASIEAEDFTPAEKAQINIPTPGLFSKSKTFTVDFTSLRESEYSFPLPVGKARASGRGLTITTTRGDAVKAMFAGTVRLSRNIPGYGKGIVIRPRNGLETVYGGNAQNLVRAGSMVRAGQSIAIAGGEGDEARLIFEIMVNGRNINPQTLLSINSHKLQKHIFSFTDKGSSVVVAVNDAGEEEVEEKDESMVDLNRELTAAETNHVGITTPDLFEGRSSITINFAKYDSKDWCYPLRDSHVISPYGGKRHHSGVDIKTGPNDEIYAAFAGKVRFSKRYSGYGNVIVIRHASGLETVYSHNSKNLVSSGDWVKAGQAIALTGRTGRATTEHCHFEIRINGRAYNPALIFDHENHMLKKVKLVVNRSGKISVTESR